MKLIIAGTRHFKTRIFEMVSECMARFGLIGKVTEIVCGCGGRDFKSAIELISKQPLETLHVSDRGIDLAGEKFAKVFDIPLKYFPADWDKYGKRAGPIRNNEMAEYADTLLLIWDGQSPGSRSMLRAMRKRGKHVYEVILR